MFPATPSLVQTQPGIAQLCRNQNSLCNAFPVATSQGVVVMIGSRHSTACPNTVAYRAYLWFTKLCEMLRSWLYEWYALPTILPYNTLSPPSQDRTPHTSAYHQLSADRPTGLPQVVWSPPFPAMSHNFDRDSSSRDERKCRSEISHYLNPFSCTDRSIRISLTTNAIPTTN